MLYLFVYLICILGICSQFILHSYWIFLPFGILILMNALFSFRWMWKKEGKAWQVLGISLFQLLLFTSAFRLLYLLDNQTHYTFLHSPKIWDWGEFTLIHILRAADFMDAIEGYGWRLQNVKSQGYISGTVVLFLHLLVDFFFFTALYKLFVKRKFTTKILNILFPLSKFILIVFLIGLGVILLQHFQTHSLFFLWFLSCLVMVAAIKYWQTETEMSKLKKEDKEGCGCLVTILIFVYFYNPAYLGKVFLGITILLSGVILLYLLHNLRFLFVFLPLTLFSIIFGFLGYGIQHSFFQATIQDFPFYLFILENLFRAIDILDMSQVYGWNWSGLPQRDWIFSSFVVSYRTLTSMFFYTYLYKLMLLWGIGDILPMDKIIEMLKDPDVYVQIEAEYKLRDSDNNEIIPYILPLLQEQDKKWRPLALALCDKLGEQDIIPYLIPLLTESEEELDSSLREQTLEILKKFPPKEVVSHITPLLKTNTSPQIKKLLLVLQELNGLTAVPSLIPLLKNSKADIRLETIRTLQNLSAKESVLALVPLLKDQKPEIREEVIETLDILEAQEAIPKILPFLQLKETQTKIASITTLGKLKAKEAIPDLLHIIKQKNPDLEILNSSLVALGEIGAKESLPEVVLLLTHPESDIRHSVVHTLVKLKANKYLPQILPLLHHQDQNICRDALDVLAGLKIKETIPEIIALLEKKPNNLILKGIVYALGELKAEKALPLLLPLLKEKKKDSELISEIICTLGKIKNPKVIPEIVPFLYSQKTLIQEEVIVALIELGAEDRLICSRCNHAKLTKMDGRYWCAWCQVWANVKWGG